MPREISSDDIAKLLRKISIHFKRHGKEDIEEKSYEASSPLGNTNLRVGVAQCVRADGRFSERDQLNLLQKSAVSS